MTIAELNDLFIVQGYDIEIHYGGKSYWFSHDGKNNTGLLYFYEAESDVMAKKPTLNELLACDYGGFSVRDLVARISDKDIELW